MDRIKNFGLQAVFFVQKYIDYDNYMVEELRIFKSPPNEDRPSLFELLDRIGQLYINGEPFIDFPRPFPIGMNYLGATGVKKQAPGAELGLKEPWISICQVENDGIILFSIGTVANTTKMPVYMSVRGFIRSSLLDV